jgi:hypothetical protein
MLRPDKIRFGVSIARPGKRENSSIDPSTKSCKSQVGRSTMPHSRLMWIIVIALLLAACAPCVGETVQPSSTIKLHGYVAASYSSSTTGYDFSANELGVVTESFTTLDGTIWSNIQVVNSPKHGWTSSDTLNKVNPVVKTSEPLKLRGTPAAQYTSDGGCTFDPSQVGRVTQNFIAPDGVLWSHVEVIGSTCKGWTAATEVLEWELK